ncbi:MAG: hypothetical protein OEO79_07190 [Gemmatimonadota bacterium]|nr:hypothetical protein [Gemmatimonadota bacterium]MDH3422078.1 hypothetical protein [Gemmatimonadota bacterium]
MILHFNYEEIQALRAGARSYLGDVRAPSSSAVLAPAEGRARVEALLPRLQGDLSFSTLGELRAVQGAVESLVESLRILMETTVLATHAADEDAVSAYFDFAHGLTVSNRISDIAAEMEAMIELVTGEPPSAEAARTFRFPD